MKSRTTHAVFQPCALAVAVALSCVAPVNMLYLSQSLTDALSVEAFWHHPFHTY